MNIFWYMYIQFILPPEPGIQGFTHVLVIPTFPI